MPKNIKGGNRAKKGKNKRKIRPLVFADNAEYSMYASIISNLGNGRCSLKIIDTGSDLTSKFKKEVQGIIRGSVRRQKFFKDDIVLVVVRNFQEIDYDNAIVDIINKYNADYARELVLRGEIRDINLSSSNQLFEEDDNIEFIRDLNYVEIDNVSSDTDSNKEIISNSESEIDLNSDIEYVIEEDIILPIDIKEDEGEDEEKTETDIDKDNITQNISKIQKKNKMNKFLNQKQRSLKQSNIDFDIDAI